MVQGGILVRVARLDHRVMTFLDAPRTNGNGHSPPLVNRLVHGATVGALLHRRWIVEAPGYPTVTRDGLPRTTYTLNARGRLLGTLQQQGRAPNR